MKVKCSQKRLLFHCLLSLDNLICFQLLAFEIPQFAFYLIIICTKLFCELSFVQIIVWIELVLKTCVVQLYL